MHVGRRDILQDLLERTTPHTSTEHTCARNFLHSGELSLSANWNRSCPPANRNITFELYQSWIPLVPSRFMMLVDNTGSRFNLSLSSLVAGILQTTYSLTERWYIKAADGVMIYYQSHQGFKKSTGGSFLPRSCASNYVWNFFQLSVVISNWSRLVIRFTGSTFQGKD